MTYRFYNTPKATWDAMLEDCRAARRSIEMEQYIVANDDVGRAFLELFLLKLQEGVAVRLLLDRVGSRTVYGSRLIREIEAAGGQVRFYNPPRLIHMFRPARWFPRNHVKTLLVDSEIAYIGGVCLEAPMAEWRDNQVRMTGSIVQQMEARFELERINWRVRRKARREERRTERQQARTESLEPLQYIVHRPHLGPNPIYRRIVRAIRRAEHSVQLVTPYFLPPFGLRRAMRQAAKRGVRVSVTMSEATDSKPADWVSQSFFPFMYRAGIRINLFRPVMLHAKYVIIDPGTDKAWATLGSTNLDYLSLKHNREANIIIRDKTMIDEMMAQLTADKAECMPVDRDYWHKLPLWRRAMGYAFRLIKKIL